MLNELLLITVNAGLVTICGLFLFALWYMVYDAITSGHLVPIDYIVLGFTIWFTAIFVLYGLTLIGL